MERLTRKDKCKLSHGEEIIICNHDKQDCNDSCMRIKPCKWYKKVQEKLWEYENAEEQGLLLRLPCKVGTSVYMVAQDCGGDTLDCRRGDCEGCSDLYNFVEESKFEAYMLEDIGNTVFLTQEEAEQKLKEMESY